jgi:hypothetical protein
MAVYGGPYYRIIEETVRLEEALPVQEPYPGIDRDAQYGQGEYHQHYPVVYLQHPADLCRWRLLGDRLRVALGMGMVIMMLLAMMFMVLMFMIVMAVATLVLLIHLWTPS